MPYKERQIKKLYYSIGEVSKILDIKPSTIRSWEKDYKNIKPRKNRKGDRMFTDKDIHNLRVVKKLVYGEEKQTVQEVNQQIKENKKKNDNLFSAKQRLEQLKFEMKNLKAQLQRKQQQQQEQQKKNVQSPIFSTQKIEPQKLSFRTKDKLTVVKGGNQQKKAL